MLRSSVFSTASRLHWWLESSAGIVSLNRDSGAICPVVTAFFPAWLSQDQKNKSQLHLRMSLMKQWQLFNLDSYITLIFHVTKWERAGNHFYCKAKIRDSCLKERHLGVQVVNWASCFSWNTIFTWENEWHIKGNECLLSAIETWVFRWKLEFSFLGFNQNNALQHLNAVGNNKIWENVKQCYKIKVIFIKAYILKCHGVCYFNMNYKFKIFLIFNIGNNTR